MRRLLRRRPQRRRDDALPARIRVGPRFVTTATESCDVLVLGAGLGGLAVSQRLCELGIETDVFEKSGRVGGLASTRVVKGFRFDHGPHVSFTKRDEIRQLFASAVQGRFRERPTRLLNNWNKRWITHPAQSHLYGLPSDLVARCILDFVERPKVDKPRTYEEWCVAHLGQTFSDEFTFRYTRRYWTAEASELTADWVSNRVHAPSLAELVRGALGPQPANQHYISTYRYPTDGGFEPYLAAVIGGQRVHLHQEAVSWDPIARVVEFASGRSVQYEQLVSSLPVPVLVRICVSAPESVRAAADALSCSSVVLVNIGLARADSYPDADWIYFYDDDVPFARGYCPHRLAHANAPEGCGSFQVEIYHSKYRTLPAGDLVGATLEAMRRCDLLRHDDRVIVAEAIPVEFANVIFDHARSSALQSVSAFLDSTGVVRCGRFGEWAYFWTDDTILSGWGAATEVGARRANRARDI